MSVSLASALDRLTRESPFQPVGDAGGGIRVAGRGSHAVVVLPGLVGPADALAALADPLEGHQRVVLVTYPRVDGLAALLAWLDAVRRRVAGEAAVAVYGGSFGGLVAQAWLRHAPEALADIVISGTGPPDARRAMKNARALPWMRRLPDPAWRTLLRLAVRLSTARAPEREVWRAFYGAAIAPLVWADLESRYRVSLDIDRGGPPGPGALARWRGRLLVLEGSRDRVARGAARVALRATYPQADFQVFEGAGHGLALEQPDAWLQVVGAFLRGPVPGSPRDAGSA